VALCLTYSSNPTIAHTMGFGSCPRIDPVKQFSMDKFMGDWYAIQKFATSSSCMKYNFTKGVDGKLRLVQTRQHFILDTIGVDHIYTYTGTLSVPDSETAGRMRVKFPLNVAGDSEFVVFMTDYETYAGIFTCQKVLFGHSKSATILSRKPTLDKAVVNQIRQRLEEEGVDPDDFSIVDQSKCIAESNLNVKIDDKTFSAGNVADVVKKVGGAIGVGVEKAGDIIGDGIVKATDLGSGLIKKYGEESSTARTSRTRPSLDDLYKGAQDKENDAEWI